MKPVNLRELAGAVGGRILAPDGALATDEVVTGVSTDSRRTQPGDLFIALKGPNVDGHDFLGAAFERGAAAAMVMSPPGPFAPLVLVEDTTVGLGRIAAFHAGRMPALRIGVTGSSGKTTTKEMLASALGATGPTLKSEASQNGETGVPLALLNLEETDRFAVLEMGMRGPGQIRYLAEIVQPEVGVVTNIGRAHLEFLGSVEAIARAKGELLEALPEDGVAILPAGDAQLPLLRSLCACRIVTFGLEESADVRAGAIRSGQDCSTFRLTYPGGESTEMSLPVPGEHNIRNAAAAMAVVWSVGADLGKAMVALRQFQPPPMRSSFVDLPSGARLLHDAYNANPDSMIAALDVLSTFPPRRVAVLGDMLELGAIESEEHRALGRDAAARVDVLIAVGPRSKEIADAARASGLPAGRIHWFPDTAAAVDGIGSLIRRGDTVLLKGSRGMRLEAVANTLIGETRP